MRNSTNFEGKQCESCCVKAYERAMPLSRQTNVWFKNPDLPLVRNKKTSAGSPSARSFDFRSQSTSNQISFTVTIIFKFCLNKYLADRGVLKDF